MKNRLPGSIGHPIFHRGNGGGEHLHSFYAAHHEEAYQYLMSDYDEEMLTWLQLFSQYDLYSKTDEELDIECLRPYYEELVREYLPQALNW
ncbi:MAG: hypothetical protein KR126chlam3_01039 [Chlamydiae bacterium]|nr:hypothetical protein [Chlamydiota bacterium]